MDARTTWAGVMQVAPWRRMRKSSKLHSELCTNKSSPRRIAPLTAEPTLHPHTWEDAGTDTMGLFILSETRHVSSAAYAERS
jgi:hypothetical protein